MVTFELILTEKCNLKCKYCFERKHRRIEEMNAEDAKKYVGYMFKYASNLKERDVKIVFFGGEPLLKFSLIKSLTEYITKLYGGSFNLYYFISTNGILLDERIIKFFIKNDFEIQVSLDGAPKSQDINRVLSNGRGSSFYYDRIFSHLQYISSVKFPIIKMVVDPSNIGELYNNILYLAKNCCAIISMSVNYGVNWSQEAYDQYYKQIDLVTENYLEIRKLGSAVNEIETVMKAIKNGFNQSVSFCHAGTKSFTITPGGYIYPCSMFLNNRKFCLGNICAGMSHNDKLSDLYDYNNQKHKCKYVCKLFPVCQCRCVYLNYVDSGEFGITGDFRCVMQKSLINLCLKNLTDIIRKYG